jgi:hypothetical protein
MFTLSEIEALTKDFSDARNVLVERVQNLNDEIEAAKRRLLPGIKKAVAAVSQKRSVLHSAVEDSADLFVKPRTVVFHGIKVGFQKGKGAIEWDDDAQVVKLIRKHFPDQFDTLVKTTEKPVKGALENLSVQELKWLGVSVSETGDQVVIKATDSSVDKLVKALLKAEEAETVGEEKC